MPRREDPGQGSPGYELVDPWGKFFGSRKELMDHKPKAREVEREVRAQIDLAIKKGLRVSYIDHHMSAAVETPEMRTRFEKVAKDYAVAVSRWFGEKEGPKIYQIEPAAKADFLVEGIRNLKEPGLYILVCHPGVNTPELSALKDIHPWAPKNMAEHREAEMLALCDPRLKQALQDGPIELVGYDYLQKNFLHLMKPPK